MLEASVNAMLLLLAGFVLLALGAELVVRTATRLAVSLGVTPMMIGLTVVAVGTSMPELVVAIVAGRQGSGGLAVGNISGTNMLNILFILGLTALLRPLPLHLRVLKLDLPVMVVAAGMMAAMAWDGSISRLDGGLLCGAAVIYTAALIRLGRNESQAVKAEFEQMCAGDSPGRECERHRVRDSMLLAAGIGSTILGAQWLVDGAVDVARVLNVSEELIGLTIVAIGTSAPEFATTVVATIRDARDVAIGNLLGSSIYNILAILGIATVVTPGGFAVERQLLLVDIPLMLGVALLCIPVFVTGRQVSRAEGGLFVGTYLAYLTWLLVARP